MPRPSQNTDQRLVEAARDLMSSAGISRLNLRQVAKKAGVNLGMFHYHFKTKEAFSRRVLQETYDEFFKEFTLESSKDEKTLEQLRAALAALGQFIMRNRRVVLGLLHDVLNKDRVALDFVKANGPRHAQVILRLIRQCQKEGSLRKMPITSVMPLVMGTVAAPALFLAMMERLGIRRFHLLPMIFIKRELASDRGVEERVDLALSAIALGTNAVTNRYKMKRTRKAVGRRNG